MRYFDTSVLVPLILFEDTSGAVTVFFEKLLTEKLAISHWTRVEFAPVLARHVRMGDLGVAAARAASSRFEAMIAASFEVLLPDRNDFGQAQRWLGRPKTRLRAGDALHLAIASNHGATAIHTLDKVMIAEGVALGLPVGPEIDVPGYGD